MTQAPPESRNRTAELLMLAATARAVQIAIRAQLLRDVATLWPILDAKRLDVTLPAWLRAMSLLTTRYHGQSAAASGRSYQVMREHATDSPAPSSLLKIAMPPSQEWMDKAFGFSGPGMLDKETARPGSALSTTLGTASRIALEGGRRTMVETVEQDPVAVGWYRVTDGHPCAFCALLASRVSPKTGGAPYKSARSFKSSNSWFTGPGMVKVHDMCGCGFVPSFSHTNFAPTAIGQKAAEVYDARERGIDGLVAFRKAWAAHLASGATPQAS